MKMMPATQTDLDNITKDYQEFLKLGNSEMKAAWLAVSGRGFTEIIKSNKNHTQLLRESDNKFIIYTYETEDLKPQEVVRKTISSWHIDESVLKGSGE
jgi:hypothetical protein